MDNDLTKDTIARLTQEAIMRQTKMSSANGVATPNHFDNMSSGNDLGFEVI